ncbi:hypothetical protein ACHQM5_028010 [Ranunculus cassubicifolius]
MEGAKLIKGTQMVMKTQIRRVHASSAQICMTKISRKSVLYSQNVHDVFGVPKSEKHIYARRSSPPLYIVVAETGGPKYSAVRMPFQPTSPEGRLLSCVLQNKQHLFSFAVSEILDELVSHRDEATAQKAGYSSFQEPVLTRRIAEMKEKERQVAVEDLMYMSIVHKFSEFEVPMVANLSEYLTSNKLEIWPTNCRELESMHSLEVQEMIKEHAVNIFLSLFNSRTIDKQVSTTKVDRLHLGRIYAVSVLYGYFLKSASLRRQLDSSLSWSTEDIGKGKYFSVEGNCPDVFGNFVTLSQPKITQDKSLCQESQRCNEKLSTYLMSIDSELSHRYPKLNSKEAANVIEKHTWALFGVKKFSEICLHNKIDITFPSLERLVFEAATFGSFLCVAERAVDLVYRLEAT